MPLEVTNREYVEDQDHTFADIHERLTLDTSIIYDLVVPSYSLQGHKKICHLVRKYRLKLQGSNDSNHDLSKQICNLREELEFNVHSYVDPFVVFLKSASGPMFLNLIIVEIVCEFLWELSFISFPFLIWRKNMHRI